MGLLQSAAAETVALVLSGCIIGVAGYILNKNRQFYKKVTVGLFNAAEVKEALVGEPASDLNPNPQPGLMKRVENVEHLLQNGLHADVRDIKAEQARVRIALEKQGVK